MSLVVDPDTPSRWPRIATGRMRALDAFDTSLWDLRSSVWCQEECSVGQWTSCGGLLKCGYPHSWMVYEGKSIYQWMIHGYPHLWKPPCVLFFFAFFLNVFATKDSSLQHFLWTISAEEHQIPLKEIPQPWRCILGCRFPRMSILEPQRTRNKRFLVMQIMAVKIPYTRNCWVVHHLSVVLGFWGEHRKMYSHERKDPGC